MGDSAYRSWRRRLPERFERPGGRLLAWLDMMVMDHGFMRPFFNRPQEIAPGIWRSNQPTPRRLRKLAGRGIRTVVNLRGESDRGAWLLERDACERHGIRLVDLRLASRRPPHREQVRELLQILVSAEKPLLLHCKSGADRAGLVSALILHLHGEDETTVRSQLSLRYLHLRQAQTGVLDHFLEHFLAWHEATGDSLAEWIERDYDRRAVKQSFKPSGWANVLVDTLLRRE